MTPLTHITCVAEGLFRALGWMHAYGRFGTLVCATLGVLALVSLLVVPYAILTPS